MVRFSWGRVGSGCAEKETHSAWLGVLSGLLLFFATSPLGLGFSPSPPSPRSSIRLVTAATARRAAWSGYACGLVFFGAGYLWDSLEFGGHVWAILGGRDSGAGDSDRSLAAILSSIARVCGRDRHSVSRRRSGSPSRRSGTRAVRHRLAAARPRPRPGRSDPARRRRRPSGSSRDGPSRSAPRSPTPSRPAGARLDLGRDGCRRSARLIGSAFSRRPRCAAEPALRIAARAARGIRERPLRRGALRRQSGPPSFR
jgi:hypothetical protein